MEQYLDISCPQCERSLQIREEHAGRSVACNTCNHAFVASRGSPRFQEPSLARDTPPPTKALDRDWPVGWQSWKRLEDELRQVRAELAVRTAEHAGVARTKVGLEEQLMRSHRLCEEQQQQLAGIRRERDAARVQVASQLSLAGRIEELTRDLRASRGSAEQWDLERAALLRQIDTVRERLVTQESQLSRLAQLELLHRSSAALQIERDALLEERARLLTLKTQLEAQLLHHESLLRSLQQQLAAQMDTGMLREELEQARRARRQAEERLVLAEDQRTKLHEELRVSQDGLRRSIADLERLRSQPRSAEEDEGFSTIIKTLQCEIGDLRNTVRETLGREEAANRALTALSERFEAWQRKPADDSELRELQTRFGLLQEERDRLIELYGQERDQLQSKLRELESAKEAALRQASDSASERASWLEKEQQLRGQLISLEARLQSAETRRESAEARADAHWSDAQKAQAMWTEAMQAQEAFQPARDKLEAELAKVNHQLEVEREATARIRESLEDARSAAEQEREQFWRRLSDSEAHHATERGAIADRLLATQAALDEERSRLVKRELELQELAVRFRSHAVAMRLGLEQDLKGVSHG